LEKTQAHTVLAAIYQKQGHRDMAIEEYKKAIALAPAEGGFLYFH